MSAAVINTGLFTLMQRPGLRATWGIMYKQYERQDVNLLDHVKSTMQYEEYAQVTDFGLASIKPQGQATVMDYERQGWPTRITNVVWSTGYGVTWEEIQNNLYPKIGSSRQSRLMRAMQITREYEAAHVYDRAATSGYTGGDGVTLASTAHPNFSGGTWANRPTVDSALSPTSLEDAWIAVRQFKDDRGKPINLPVKSLIVPVQEYPNACRILHTLKAPGNANNDINFLNSEAIVPVIHANIYLAGAHAWFLRTQMEVDKGMIYQEHTPPDFQSWNDDATRNMLCSSIMSFGMGWNDPRAVWCNMAT